MASHTSLDRDTMQLYADRAVAALTEEQRTMLKVAMMSDTQFMAAVKRFEEGEDWEPRRTS